jgi:hypothetical protein
MTTRSLPAVVAFATASALAAQASFLLERASPGSIGGNLQFRYSGATQPILALAASDTANATTLPPSLSNLPLAIGPNLTLFVELVAGSTGTTSPIAVPYVPALAGTVWQWQAASLPGAVQLVDALSNRVATQLGLSGRPTLLPATATGAAWGAKIHRPDPNGGPGTWLIAGGALRPTIQQQPLATSDVLGPQTLEVSPGPQLPNDIYGMTTTELLDGRTLLLGGVTTVPGSGTPLLQAATGDAILYQPASNTFTAVAPMSTPRFLHAATRLPDGRVLVVGGTPNADLTQGVPLSTTEIFDPATLTWSAGPTLPSPWLLGAITTLWTGEILLHGGLELGPSGLAAVPACLRLVASGPGGSLQWQAGPTMVLPRAVHDATSIVLADGRLLVAGGCVANTLFGVPLLFTVSDCEIYDPLSCTWQATQPAPGPFCNGAICQRPSGEVVAVGGIVGNLSGGPTFSAALNSAAAWDPTTGQWQQFPPMLDNRILAAAVALQDGLVVILGGQHHVGPGTGNSQVETIRL